MAKGSDIIKIGFDYKASLEQFEKETNGVFDGISAKAGKQRISIQLDAKNDKVIEKIKELQKLKLDKFTFEFGESGLAEQLKTFDQLEKKINEIINLSKGITSAISKTDFGTKNKTEAYNQLKQMADAFKNFYGNEEAMHSKAGTDAAYAYYKAYEEALQKGVAQSKLEKVTVDVEADGFYNANGLSSDRIKEFNNFKNYGGDITNLSLEISDLEQRLLKFRDAYSQVESNLGEAPITPEIVKNIENYVRALEVAENRTKDADLFGFTKEDLESDKDYANMYLGFALEDAIEENKKYVFSLNEVREEKEKTDEVLNHSSTSTINDSQFDELKADVVEIREELNGVKEKISVIGSDGFENIKSDVEKTTESVKELNSELTELKSKVGDKSNISSDNTSASSTVVSEESNALDKVSNFANEASVAKEKLANANKEVKESAESSSDAIKNEGIKLEEVEKNIEKYRASLDKLSNNPDAEHRFPEFDSTLTEINTKIQELESLRDNLRVDDNGFVNADDVKEINTLTKEIDNLVVSAKQFPQALRGWKDVSATKLAEKFNKALEDNPRLSKKARDEIQALYNELRTGNPSMPLDQMHNRLNQIIQDEREAGRAGKNWLDIFKEKKIYGFLGQMASMFSFYDLINVGKQGIQTVRELDTALTEMRKVSDESVQSLKNYQATTFDVADAVGTTAGQIQNSTADWMRLGYSIDEAAELAKNSNIYKNVGDMEIEEATEHMISSVQAWKSEFNDNVIDTSQAIIDRYNKIGNEFAISSADIGEAMETSAAALKAGGNSLNESLGILTAANIIQQDASTTSSALKILSLRIRGRIMPPYKVIYMRYALA